MFFKLGVFLDKLFYAAFPKKNDLHKVEFPDISMPDDLRGQDDKAFLDYAQPMLEALEDIRQIKFKAYSIRKKIAIPVSMVVLGVTGYLDWMLLFLQRGNEDGGAGITIFAAGLIYWWVTQPKREYALAYKQKILPKLALLFGDFQYNAKGKIIMGEMKPSGLIPSYDNYSSEDYFQGRYKGISVEFSEIKLTEEQGSGKNRRTVTKFKGLAILIILTNKKFLGHTTLQRNASKIGQWFKEKTTKMKRANMVDPEFEKIFDAYTTDQVEARYLIDPLMIENLKALYEEYDGKTMSAAWYDSKMLILISSNHNHFEPADIKIPATDPQSVVSMKHEIGQILSIIDILDLYDPDKIEQEKLQSPLDAAVN